MNYKDQKCAVCGKVFDETSDIVVCPDCGAPHHRDCYFNSGRCAFDSDHAEGFVWAPEKKETVRTDFRTEEGEGTICRVCGNINPFGAGFCNRCGAELSGTGKKEINEFGRDPVYGENRDDGYDGMNAQTRPLYGAGIGKEADFPYESYSFDGINGNNWRQYIGKSVPFYFSVFSIMDQTKRKSSFSWAAGLFPYAYFAYRKVWWAAILTALLNIVLAIPSQILTMVEMGISNITMTESLFAVLSFSSTACTILNFAVKILSAIFGFWIYRKNASKKLSAAVNEARPISEGPSILGVVIVLVLLVMISGALSMKYMDVSAYFKLLGLEIV